MFSYKSIHSTLLLAFANDQIMSVCTQILMQAVTMVKHIKIKIDQDGSSKKKMFFYYISLFFFQLLQQQNPYVFLQDENFALTCQLVKPNSQQDQRKNAAATTEIPSTDEFLKKYFGILVNHFCVFFCQLFFYQMNQLEVSCMQPLCSIANQEKVTQLIYLAHQILLMWKTIKEI